jgi:hypothetical protein
MKIKSYVLRAGFLLLMVFLVASCSPGRFLSFGSTPTPTLSPTLTLTPVPPTPIPSPTPMPTPTPVPAARVTSGDRAMFYGDWEQARLEYQAALAGTTDPEILSAALLGTGRLDYIAGDHRAALAAFRKVIDEYPDSPHLPAAHFHLGQTYDELDRYEEAANEYKAYVDLKPGYLDAFMLERSGDAYFAMRDYQNALNDYQASLSSLAPEKPLRFR